MTDTPLTPEPLLILDIEATGRALSSPSAAAEPLPARLLSPGTVVAVVSSDSAVIGTGRRPPASLPDALLLTDREAAALCGLGRSTWQRLRAAGKVPLPLRIGRNVRWNKAELLAWINHGTPDARTWEAIKATGKRLRVAP